MIHIILTLDYELFGNGAGSVINHMIVPTENILKICNKYQVPITIMLEVIEYAKFIEFESDLISDLDYSPAKLIRNQIHDAYKNSHDVQMHIHPQWIDATYQNGKWIIENPDLSINSINPDTLISWIKNGKVILYDLLKQVYSDYDCCALRFTNLFWKAVPRKSIIPMHVNGIKIHSLQSETPNSINPKGFWALDSDYPVYEIPIHAVENPFFMLLFSPLRIKTAIYRQKFVSKYQTSKNITDGNSLNWSQLKRIFRPYRFKWDFCKQTARQMIQFLDHAIKCYDYRNYEIPLVMIAHSKDFFNEKNLDGFLNRVKKEYGGKNILKFSTFKKFSNEIININ